MRIAQKVVFRRITPREFFDIYKPKGHYATGGGQSYIDFSKSVPLKQWREFFKGISPKIFTGRPAWEVSLNSLGIGQSQKVKIGQRRGTSVSIRSQKLQSASKSGNRVYAWHPEYTKFPQPQHVLNSSQDPSIKPLIANLVIYIIRDNKGTYWAGWFQRPKPAPKWSCDARLLPMFSKDNGSIALSPGISFDEGDIVWPFRGGTKAAKALTGDSTTDFLKEISPQPHVVKGSGKTPTEEEILQGLLVDDVVADSPKAKETIRKVWARNTKAVKKLKALYGKCQITGTKYVFQKVDGSPYVEGHHLIHLGRGGSDASHNLVIISAHIHRMLHYAEVSQIDLSKIQNNRLKILINAKPFTITWHPQHAKIVEAAAQKKTKIKS
jgi:5-methylcytosine-specific restriction protein A